MNDFIFTTEFLTEFSLSQASDFKISAIILYEDKLSSIYKEDLMGETSSSLVKKALNGYKIKEVNASTSDNLVDLVRQNIEDEDYIIVLYANTPLIKEESVSDALSYATTKNLDYCKLYHGAIFKTEAVKNNKIEYTAEANFLNKEDFFAIFNNATCIKARNILKNRILDGLSKSGVKFYDKDSCYIDSTVEILSGVEIFSNNTLKGFTKIMPNTRLFENNIIVNSEIGENCEITSSYLKNVTIKKNSKIGPFEKIIKEKK